MKGIPAEKKRLSGHVSEDEPSRKKTCIDHECLDFETESILNGAKLTDLHVHFAQQLLKQQFPHLNGLQPTVLQAKKSLGVRKPYLTNFRWYIPVETTGFLHQTLAAEMVMWTCTILYTDQLTKQQVQWSPTCFSHLLSRLLNHKNRRVELTVVFCHIYSYCSCSWNQSIKFRPISNEKEPSQLFHWRFADIVSILLI